MWLIGFSAGGGIGHMLVFSPMHKCLIFRHRDSPEDVCKSLSYFLIGIPRTGKLQVRLRLSSHKHAKYLNSPLQTHVCVHIHVGPTMISQVLCVHRCANILLIKYFKSHCLSCPECCNHTPNIWCQDFKTHTLTHLSLKGFLRRLFSISTATQEEKAWPHIKMTPGGNSSVRHTQKYAWKEGKTVGEEWTSTRWLIS